MIEDRDEPLAIAHEIGQRWESSGRAVLTEWAKTYRLTVEFTDPTTPDPVDGYVYRNGTLVGVVEAKTRSPEKGFTYAQLMGMGETYLITEAKVLRLIRIARRLNVASYVIVQLACGTRWWWCVADPEGAPMFDRNPRMTWTKATSLGEKQKQRLNAFLPFAQGRRW